MRILLLVSLFCCSLWGYHSEEEEAINYLKALNIRYPKFGENAVLEVSLELSSIKSSLKEMLEKTFEEKGEILDSCGGPAKFLLS